MNRHATLNISTIPLLSRSAIARKFSSAETTWGGVA
jgi:hypothetical protein